MQLMGCRAAAGLCFWGQGSLLCTTEGTELLHGARGLCAQRGLIEMMAKGSPRGTDSTAQHLLQQEQNRVQLCLLLVRDFAPQLPWDKFKLWFSKVTQTSKGSRWDVINWRHWRWLSWD